MSLFVACSICEVGKDAVGVAGNIFAFGLFLSPIPTFRRIIRNGSTEMFSGLPYIYSLMNCLICLWYGTPLISPDNLLITTVNSIGATFQFVYIILFLMHAENAKKVRMLGLLLVVLGIFAIILVGSLQIADSNIRRAFVGFLSCVSLISMFASPLFVINLVIRTKSVEFMPFYLSLSTFLMSVSFFLYGFLSGDAFVYVPNGIGTLLGLIQLVLYFYYNRSSSEDSRESLILVCKTKVNTLVMIKIYGLSQSLKVGVAPSIKKIVESPLRWCGHVWRRLFKVTIRRVDQMKFGPISRGRWRLRKITGETPPIGAKPSKGDSSPSAIQYYPTICLPCSTAPSSPKSNHNMAHTIL
ncbi:hypothetical protein Lal_00019883 [Lupinus albus]|nr:hypothetical protein Lal_00019883 [Lupinus albus]